VYNADMNTGNRIILRLLVFFWYSIMWVIATVKWIPDAVGSVTDEDLYMAMLSLGISITLLVPIYFIFRVGGQQTE